MTTQVNARVGEVTHRIIERSRRSRQAYLARIDAAVAKGPARKRLGCANFAHGFAACGTDDKEALREGTGANLAIVTAYNDMLSAHQPYARFPDLIKEAARAVGGSAQVAGGVPAMCDGVTQGEKGMELSLFSRDVIALSTAVALSHDMFDAAVYLGVCDKIVPGLVDRRAVIRPFARSVSARGTHALGPWQHREVESPSALRRGQGEPRRVAGGGSRGLSRARHVHLLWDGEHQPDADGDHGPAPAGLLLRQSQYAAARRAHHARRQAGAGDHRARQSIRADRARDRRAGDRQWRGRASCDGRLDQSHHSPGGDGRRRRDCAPMGGFRRSCGSDAASDPDLSEREGRREPFPRRGRHEPLDPRTSRGRACARRRADRLGSSRRLCG